MFLNLKNLSIEEKIGQMLMIGFEGYFPDEKVIEFISKNNIGFIDIFARNFKSINQMISLTNKLHSLGKIQPMLFTDQEGGIVCQFGEKLSTYISPMGLTATGKPENSFLVGKGIAQDLKKIGIDGNIAPVVDVVYEEENPIIGIRAFSDNPEKVSLFAKEFAKGVFSEGVAPLLKHYPGHGGTKEDSHLTLPEVYKTLEFVIKNDLYPYFKLSKDIDFIMGAHVVFPLIDKEVATFSNFFCTSLLREKIKFKGVLITDCLEMAAIKERYTPREIVLKAVRAGADVLLVSHSLPFQKLVLKELLSLVKKGEISEKRIDESVKRILNAKKKYGMLLKRKKIIKVKTNTLRKKREEEIKIALSSISILKNKLIPIPKNSKIGIIEWEKARSTVEIAEAKQESYLAGVGKRYFKEVNVKILPLKKEIQNPPHFNDFLKKHDFIIAGTYSRNPHIEKLQTQIIKELLKKRKDIIVVALGNPYDIREIPEVENYIATYGFRDVQLEALFKILTGEEKASGILPVSIKKLTNKNEV